MSANKGLILAWVRGIIALIIAPPIIWIVCMVWDWLTKLDWSDSNTFITVYILFGVPILIFLIAAEYFLKEGTEEQSPNRNKDNSANRIDNQELKTRGCITKGIEEADEK